MENKEHGQVIMGIDDLKRLVDSGKDTDSSVTFKEYQNKYTTFAAVAAEDIVYVMLATLPLPEVKRILEVAKNISSPDMQIKKIAKDLVIEYCNSRRLPLESVLTAMFDGKSETGCEFNERIVHPDGVFRRAAGRAGSFVFQDTADVLKTLIDTNESTDIVSDQENKE